MSNNSNLNSSYPIHQAFENKKPLIVYLMAGDPDLETSARYILAAQEAGADMIEIGIPFSDPIAEGEVIQQASVRALKHNISLEQILNMVEGIRDQMRIPLVFMTYLNPVFTYGYSRLFKRCRECGIDGLIIPDLPLEEQGEVKQAAGEYGIHIISLIAPTSGERIKKIARTAEGFLYLVSSMGVTGVRQTITTDIEALVKEIRKYTDIPVAVGFGISTPGQAAYFASVSDGAIVGSAFVKLIGEHGTEAEPYLTEAISNMKKGMLE